MLGAEVGFEHIEIGGFFGAVNELLRVEAVLKGVAAGVGFSFWSSRAGTMLRVGAIDFGARWIGSGR
jgi:hypothetical protein